MTISTIQPAYGQFVAIWEYAGEPCSLMLRHLEDGSGLEVYVDEYQDENGDWFGDEWREERSFDRIKRSAKNMIYYTTP